MIFDNFKNIETYKSISPFIERIASIVNSVNDNNFELENPPVFDDGFKIIFIKKDIEQNKTVYCLERHRQNIDFHYVIDGVDEIGIRKIEKCKFVSQPYKTDGDYELFNDEPEYRFKLMRGDFLMITPAHAHDTLLRKGIIKKIVFKIPIY